MSCLVESLLNVHSKFIQQLDVCLSISQIINIVKRRVIVMYIILMLLLLYLIKL